MKLIIRLYRMHDYDLMLLKYSKTISFNATIKSILKSYINGKVYTIDLSNKISDQIIAKNLPYHSSILLTLDDNKDADIIQLLNNITDGYRNNFIKHLLRMYLGNYCLNQYLSDPSSQIQLDHTSHEIVTPFEKNQKKTKKIKKDSIQNQVEKTKLLPQNDTAKIKNTSISNPASVLQSVNPAPVLTQPLPTSIPRPEPKPEPQIQLQPSTNSDALSFFQNLM